MNDAIDEAAADSDDSVAALTTFVGTVEHLPLFTAMAAQLIRSVDREDVGAPELSRMIAADPALVAHLLRIVNSSFYGLTRRIGTVSEAVSVLGLDLIRRTVTVAVLQRPLFAYLHDTAVAREFWKHELLTAALSRHLAQRAGINGELTFMAGLLHDVGRLVMLTQFADQSDVLLRRLGRDDDTGIAEEQATFGFTHAQVGGALLELWGLPEGIVQAAHQHVDETEPEDRMAAAVWRANLIAREFGDDDLDDEADPPWMESIGLDRDARRLMLEEIQALAADDR
jgi:putative nucleotidyltransferase with HDIG domain